MRICLIGASKGIGLALCKKLLEQGHSVWAIARTADAGLKELAIKYPDALDTHSLDITDERAVAQWAERMGNSNTIMDALILNASVQEPDLKETYDHNAGKKMLRVNLEGNLHCIGALLPLLQRDKGGTVLAIASTTALRPSMQSAAYSASKAGIAMAMRALRLKYGSSPVQFKTAYLGPIQTTMWEGKQSVLVPSPGEAASALIRFLQSNRPNLYYPKLTTTLLRMTLWLPDRFFSFMSKSILH